MGMARQSRAPIVLLTRPDRQGQRFADQLRAKIGDVEIVLSPLMQTRFLDPVLQDRPYRALLLTSETGAEAAGRLAATVQNFPKRALCVGDRTAIAARAAGFDALSAAGDARDLIALAQRQFSAGPLLHLRGKDSAGDIAETLTKGGTETVSAIVYAQEPHPLSAKAIEVFGQGLPVLIPLFSPRSASLLAAALPLGTSTPIWVAALSPAVAEAALVLRPARTVIAAQPNGESMLHAVAEALSLPFGA